MGNICRPCRNCQKSKSKDYDEYNEHGVINYGADINVVEINVPRQTRSAITNEATIASTDSYGNSRQTDRSKKTIIPNEKRNALVCAAIDFGTTSSGYSYSFRDEPKRILANYWNEGEIRTPTVVLLNPQKHFHSFGHEAVSDYKKLMEKKEHTKWYLFKRFKMALFAQNGPIQKDMEMRDFTDKNMLAIDVFAEAIRYLTSHLIKVLNERKDKVEINQNTDIHWVLTIPAIWNDSSKAFMRQAAQRAGIANNMLTLALEPEAASLYCQRCSNSDVLQVGIPEGCRYMVLDLGGGTADITCHEVCSDETIKELHRPTGGDFGGTTVDHEFINFLNRIFGADIINKFKQQHMTEYWDFLNTFERKKKTYDGNDNIVMQYPVMLTEIFEENIGQHITETIKSSPLVGLVGFRLGKMFIKKELVTCMFDVAVTKIKKATDAVLVVVNDIERIILVGGFSESPYIQKVMKHSFQDLIVVPKDPSTAVVNGAVMYGHEPRAISTRVSKFTYGIAKMMKFKNHHPITKKIVMSDGVEMVDDIFNKHFEIGEIVDIDKADEVEAHEYFPTIAEMKQAVLEVYASTHENPKFVTDEGCQLVGTIKVDIDPMGDKWAKILVKLIFGGTELLVEVKEEKTGKVTEGVVDFWG